MAALSKKVFLTPNSMFAFIDRAHEKHEQASAFFRYFSEQEYQLFTNSITIHETYTQIYHRMSPSIAKDFLRTVFISDMNIIYPEESDVKAALKTLIAYRTTDLMFSQALTAVLANRRGVSQICTFEFLHPLFGLNVFYLPI